MRTFKILHVKESTVQISSEDLHFKFISYGLNSITSPTTTRQIILRQNIFLDEMDIIPINGILQKDELQVMDSFKQSTNFTAMESTRKSSESKWILVTTTKHLYNAGVEADSILANFTHQPHHISRSINNVSSPKGAVTNHFPIYEAVLSQTMKATDTSKMTTSPPNQYTYPVTTTFNSINNNSIYATPQKIM